MFETMKRILDMAGKYRRYITSGIVISLFHSLFSAMDLLAILYLSYHLNDLNIQKIGNVTVIVLVGLIGKIICKWKITEHISGSSYDIFYEKRLEVGKRLKKAPMGYFSEKNLGEIQVAATTNMNELESSAMSVVENILGSLIYVAICTCVLLVFSWQIGLVTLLGLVIGIFLLSVVQAKAKQAMPLRFEVQEEMTEKTLEFIQGNMVMRLFGVGEDSLKRVQDAFHQKRKADIYLENAAIWPISFYKYTFRIASCAVVLIASLLYMQESMSFPICVMLMFAAFLVYSQMDGLASNIALLRIVDTSLGRVEKVLNIPEMSGSMCVDNLSNNHIELRNVSFSYDNRTIIHEVSLFIPEKSVTAIVGHSGSGKTTLCNLIARFWDVQQGEVLVGGHNVKRISSEELMKKISIVFQNVYLFQDTIENNIKFGEPNASHEDVVDAAKKACCHEFIMQLANGYQTIIGEGGSTLSGGEKQRISIARAILKDAPIVILDEATSSVDLENQHALLTAINELTKGKTLITIAHRLETVRDADQIIVLDEGRIVQQGTHEALIQQDGIYRRFIEVRQMTSSWKL
ncbi:MULTISPECIES: ABC transporter ATP-binding protein [Lachnospiraceae]|uniref:ABC transporter ATP-binding protein n=1 Tax=Lachnospiraceae TaxID=186803 RepID=UPI0006DC1EBB|nr:MULTISPECIES: ABC transporter ATP-binding protein [Lachnospiraceae]MDB6486984.1 ABC transporter ATP-binding protein [Blautia wexlerae]